MEQYFRMALWMFLLVGYLQAAPLITVEGDRFRLNKYELQIKYLKESVRCDQTVTFNTPTNTEETCYKYAMRIFMNGLQNISDGVVNCEGGLLRAENTLEALELAYKKLPNTQGDNPAGCTLKTTDFQSFVKDIETFAERVNSS